MHVPRLHRNWESVVRVGKHVQNPSSFLHSLIIRNEPMHSRRLQIRVAFWAASRARVRVLQTPKQHTQYERATLSLPAAESAIAIADT